MKNKAKQEQQQQQKKKKKKMIMSVNFSAREAKIMPRSA